jgi:hypothetical protein
MNSPSPTVAVHENSFQANDHWDAEELLSLASKVRRGVDFGANQSPATPWGSRSRHLQS